MKRLVYTLNMLYVLAMSLWVGGMFLLGVLVEIVVRFKLKEQPILASKVMNTVMDIFNIHIIIYTCISVIVVVELVKFFVQMSGVAGFAQTPKKPPYTKEICLGIMIILALYMGKVMRPEMHVIDQSKKAAQLNALEKARIHGLIQARIKSLNKAAQMDGLTDAVAEIKRINVVGQLEKLQEDNPGNTKLKIQFDRYHQRFVWLYTINMILGLCVFYIDGKKMLRLKEESLGKTRNAGHLDKEFDQLDPDST
ncbi:MAG: hypothetical protein VYC17_02895 [Nitrospinota bacterium]|nr:hypothetical protein [Nitrospinota bacterium]